MVTLDTTPTTSAVDSVPPPAKAGDAASPQPPKPLLRGVSHQLAFYITPFWVAWLVAGARPGVATRASYVFGAALTMLFGTSALYHRVNWGRVGRARMRRLDHAAIFLLIGGGYTPLFSVVPSAHGTHGALFAIWLGVALGVAKSLVWPNAPKWITALLCVALGWTVVGQVLARAPVVGWPCVWLLVASGAIYSLGAAVYAAKRPDPWPRTFGYHEIFHALVIAASICLFLHAATVVGAINLR